MTRILKAARRAPKSGTAKSAVVFLHGYGADGADLLGLADPLAPHLPDTLFIAPDAPEPCAGNPFGRQWFPIPRLDGSSQADSEDGFDRATNDLQAFLDTLLEDSSLTPSQILLFGFSQGSMMALHVAPRRAAPIAGVVAFSGRLLRPERLAAELRARPPVLLVHGDADPMVDFAEMGRAGDALVAAGFDTFAHVMRGTGHGIAPDGLSVALAFMVERLRGA
ncbi:MAG: phospholipase [Alphaproteobacteria bacterium HGW-Alphaproteobacteria-4]|nr:MAG: phospholipase [Alphaproteobacteria bacterium HGW-Alphaproteobacteria-4]